MKRIKKAVCFLTVIVMMLALIPMPAVADGGEGVPLSDFNDYYGRSALEKLPNAEALLYAYDSIAAGVERLQEYISVYNGKNYISALELGLVVDVYMRDYAHHFWLGKTYSYSYTDTNGVVEYIPRYTMAGSTLEKAKANFLSATDEILALVDDSMTDYEKELVIHDELAKRVTYDLDAFHAHDAYGALVEGRAVCEGYAEALQYLLHRTGIQSFLIIGSSNGVGHEWNVARIDGEYYHVDITWNDQGDTIYHAYFNMSDDMITEDHFINATAYQMPVCDSKDAHYFSVNGRIVENGKSTIDEVAELIKGSVPRAHVFVNGDKYAFLQWFNDNIIVIATEVGVVGGFSYGYAALGREVVLIIDGEITETEYVLGDVSGDGMITNADVLAIYRYIYDPETYPIEVQLGDVNGDGSVTNADVLAIYRYIYNPELYPIG